MLPSLSTGYIAFQQCTEPFDKLEVRQAIAHAVNWAALISGLLWRLWSVGRFIPTARHLGQQPRYQAVSNMTRNWQSNCWPKAGLPDGFETDFWYIPVVRGYFPDSKAIGEAIAADLAKVGIKVNLMTEDLGRLSG